jgi:hypothetical protein
MTAEQTRLALAQKRAQGVLLGNRTSLPEARAKANASNRKLAASFAANVLPIISQNQAAGMTSYRGIAPELNACGIRTACGGTWRDTTVRGMILRETT